jgi:hypothetical protein
MIQDLLDFYGGKIDVGQSWGCLKLDEHYPFKKNFAIHCGAAGSGKTDIILSMETSQAIKNGKKVLAYLDEGSSRMHYFRLIGMLLGKKLFTIYPLESDPQKRIKWHVSKDEMIAGYEEVKKYVIIFDKDNEVITQNKTITTLLNAFQVYVDRGGIQSVFIDPKNAFSVDNSKAFNGNYEYEKKVLGEMRAFQSKNDLKLTLTVHPTKGARINKHKEKNSKDEGDILMGVYVGGHPKPIDLYDSENGAVNEARADDSLTFHRYRNVDGLDHYSFIHVRKVKEEETGGKNTDEMNPIVVYKNKNTWRWIFDDVDIMSSKPIAATSMSDDLPF